MANVRNCYTDKHLATVLAKFLLENGGTFDYLDGRRLQSCRNVARAMKLPLQEVRDIVYDIVEAGWHP
jgi:hypothetical protein